MLAAHRRKLRLLRGARVGSALLAAWLFVSAFVLPHTFDEAMVGWSLGSLIVLGSVGSFFAESLLYLDALLAALLVFAALLLPAPSSLTRLNECLIAVAILGLSLGAAGLPTVSTMHEDGP